MLLAHMLAPLRGGVVTIVDARGRAHRCGAGPGRELTVRLADRRLPWRLALAPDRCLGEAYADGTLAVEGGTVRDLLELCGENLSRLPTGGLEQAVLGQLARAYRAANGVGRSRRNAARHYDLDDILYEGFLDDDRQYSCAYFTHPGMTLEEAQEAKKRHLAAKLLLRPGLSVLDIGSGWGGLALHLAEAAGVEVTGITLSARQAELARRRAADAGLAGRVRFHVRDYRHEQGRYDRIVSVGMFEHVGARRYAAFFAKLHDLLTDDGVAVVHAIGRMGGPDDMDPWMQKHVFPGSHIPALSEVLPPVERAGLWLTDLEILRLHYAETLQAWQRRFLANRDTLARALGERFCRSWEFYLAYAEMGFRYGGLMVFQAQLAKRVDAVPLTRDYMFERERAPAVRADGRALSA